MRVALGTLGCKLNQAETELLSGQFAQAGYELVSPADVADIYILNTCTVTHIADRKSRHWLRMAHRRNPAAVLVATGCYAERAPGELARIEGVRLVLGNEAKTRLRQLMEEAGLLGHPVCGHQVSGPGLRTRAMVKIQDGCTSPCDYCIVPRVRGQERSWPAGQVVAEVGGWAARGVKEVVLTGTKVGSYGDNGLELKGLLVRILAETGVARLRLSSLQPQEISPELIRLWHDRRLCRHFHLSLQSGSDSVLGRMRRRYSVGDYLSAVSLIRELVPDVAITTDVIVGFPGETPAEFRESYELCRRLGFARIHVFTYSPRDGTEASRMPGQVPDGVRKQRSRSLLALAEASAQGFSRQFLGRMMPVLWERPAGGLRSGHTDNSDNYIMVGHTDNYIKVYARSGEDLSGRVLPVRLVELDRDGVWGEGAGA